MNVLLFDLVVKHKVVQTFTCDRARYHRSGKCGYIRRPTGHLLGLLGLDEHDPGGEHHDDLVRVGVRLLLLLLEKLIFRLSLMVNTHPRIAI